MATLAELAGQSAFQNASNFGQNVTQGVETGVKLASMQQQVEQQRIQQQASEMELNQKKLQGITNLSSSYMFANDAQADTIGQRLQSYAAQTNTPLSFSALEAIRKDPATRVAAQKALADLKSGKNPGDPAQVLGLFADDEAMFGYVNGLISTNATAQNKAEQALELKKIGSEAAMGKFYASSAKTDARQNETFNRQDQKEIRNGATDLATKLAKDSLPEVVSAFKGINETIGGIDSPGAIAKLNRISGTSAFLASFKIPLTDVMPLENKAFKGEDLKLYQQVASLRNAYLKLRSGGAVSDTEGGRFLQELGTGGIRSGEQLRNGLKTLQNSVATGIQNYEAGQDPESVKLYRSRQGSISSEGLLSAGSKPAAPAAPKKWTDKQKTDFVTKARANKYSQAQIDDYLKDK